MTTTTRPTEATRSDTIDAAHEIARAIRRARDTHGRPPAIEEAAEHTTHDCDWPALTAGQWDSKLRAAGVRSHDEFVADALRRMLDARYPWQDFITVRAKDVAEEIDLSAVVIGRKIHEICRDERAPDAAESLVIEEIRRNNRHSTWKVGEREEVCSQGDVVEGER